MLGVRDTGRNMADKGLALGGRQNKQVELMSQNIHKAKYQKKQGRERQCWELGHNFRCRGPLEGGN